MAGVSKGQQAAILAVPVEMVEELEENGLAFPLPVLRGAAIESVVAVGANAAMLITLLQAPDSVRAFAAWVRQRCMSSGESVELTARRGGRRVHLVVEGDVDLSVVADFLTGAFEDDGSIS